MIIDVYRGELEVRRTLRQMLLYRKPLLDGSCTFEEKRSIDVAARAPTAFGLRFSAGKNAMDL
jgi:hypothetical protein